MFPAYLKSKYAHNHAPQGTIFLRGQVSTFDISLYKFIEFLVLIIEAESVEQRAESYLTFGVYKPRVKT
jgi:hypothetical protein